MEDLVNAVIAEMFLVLLKTSYAMLGNTEKEA